MDLPGASLVFMHARCQVNRFNQLLQQTGSDGFVSKHLASMVSLVASPALCPPVSCCGVVGCVLRFATSKVELCSKFSNHTVAFVWITSQRLGGVFVV